MCLKRFIGFIGRLIGRIIRYFWEKGWSILFWFLVGLIYLLGIVLAIMGNIIVLGLGAIGALLVLALKGLAWFTYHFMCTTKWISGKVGEYTDTFFDGITNAIQKEEENLENEIRLIIRTENL